jgi:hypothetical protein
MRWLPHDRRSERERDSVKGNVFHRIVPAIARPEIEVVDGDSGSDQGVSQFHMMALGKYSEVLACPHANLYT